MKVLWSYVKDQYSLPDEIPNELLNERHALQNFGQSLRHIDQRGGMSVDEIVCNLLGYSPEVKMVTNENAFGELLKNYLKLKKISLSN
ncbi:hypothetical protein IM792_06105 [Mucilaginibacter sp. JRF]|uniref:hypothetical protein n=1 Tax=Mucilaginibacter sp. JRF TaxID=2780088 RepID=UPI001880BC1F|nr:hypothetical protein [Mucilaginibacter sp. JRF]MBE9584016.1 hypothetical protein [Mucilaginibacter sp. JRF]